MVKVSHGRHYIKDPCHAQGGAIEISRRESQQNKQNTEKKKQKEKKGRIRKKG